jgi:hypothetical protein
MPYKDHPNFAPLTPKRALWFYNFRYFFCSLHLIIAKKDNFKKKWINSFAVVVLIEVFEQLLGTIGASHEPSNSSLRRHET